MFHVEQTLSIARRPASWHKGDRAPSPGVRVAIRQRIKDRLKRALGKAPQPASEPAPQQPPSPPKAAAEAAAPKAAAPSPQAPAPAPPKAAVPKRPAMPEGAVSRPAPGSPKAREISPDKQRKAILRAKKGTLRFVQDKGGVAHLGEMHDNSERRYFVAHRGFSRLMEEMTEEGLLDYDEATGESRLTPAGAQWLSEQG